MAKIDLIRRPFHASLANLTANLPELLNEVNSIQAIVHELDDEIGVNEPAAENPLNYQTNFQEKLRKKCQQEIAAGEERCEASIKESHNKCMSMFPAVVNHVLCWPVKITNFCIFTKTLKTTCSAEIDSSFGEDYLFMHELQDQFLGNVSNVQIQQPGINFQDNNITRWGKAFSQPKSIYSVDWLVYSVDELVYSVDCWSTQ